MGKTVTIQWQELTEKVCRELLDAIPLGSGKGAKTRKETLRFLFEEQGKTKEWLTKHDYAESEHSIDKPDKYKQRLNALFDLFDEKPIPIPGYNANFSLEMAKDEKGLPNKFALVLRPFKTDFEKELLRKRFPGEEEAFGDDFSTKPRIRFCARVIDSAFNVKQERSYDPLFVGRLKEIEKATSQLRKPSSCVLITGEPGIGKSWLAEEVLYHLSHDFKILRILAGSRELTQSEIIDDIESNSEKISASNLDRLILVDGLTSKGSLSEVVRRFPKCRFLITSIHDSWDLRPRTVLPIRLDPLQPKDTEKLLEKHGIVQLPDYSEDNAKRLHEWFGGFPLGIDLAISYIKERTLLGYSPSEALRQLRSGIVRSGLMRDGRTITDYVLKMIRNEVSDSFHKEVLFAAAACSYDAVSAELISTVLSENQGTTVSAEEVEVVLNAWKRRSLIRSITSNVTTTYYDTGKSVDHNRDVKGMFQMHSLVHDCLRSHPRTKYHAAFLLKWWMNRIESLGRIEGNEKFWFAFMKRDSKLWHKYPRDGWLHDASWSLQELVQSEDLLYYSKFRNSIIRLARVLIRALDEWAVLDFYLLPKLVHSLPRFFESVVKYYLKIATNGLYSASGAERDNLVRDACLLQDFYFPISCFGLAQNLLDKYFSLRGIGSVSEWARTTDGILDVCISCFCVKSLIYNHRHDEASNLSDSIILALKSDNIKRTRDYRLQWAYARCECDTDRSTKLVGHLNKLSQAGVYLSHRMLSDLVETSCYSLRYNRLDKNVSQDDIDSLKREHGRHVSHSKSLFHLEAIVGLWHLRNNAYAAAGLCFDNAFRLAVEHGLLADFLIPSFELISQCYEKQARSLDADSWRGKVFSVVLDTISKESSKDIVDPLILSWLVWNSKPQNAKLFFSMVEHLGTLSRQQIDIVVRKGLHKYPALRKPCDTRVKDGDIEHLREIVKEHISQDEHLYPILFVLVEYLFDARKPAIDADVLLSIYKHALNVKETALWVFERLHSLNVYLYSSWEEYSELKDYVMAVQNTKDRLTRIAAMKAFM